MILLHYHLTPTGVRWGLCFQQLPYYASNAHVFRSQSLARCALKQQYPCVVFHVDPSTQRACVTLNPLIRWSPTLTTPPARGLPRSPDAGVVCVHQHHSFVYRPLVWEFHIYQVLSTKCIPSLLNAAPSPIVGFAMLRHNSFTANCTSVLS